MFDPTSCTWCVHLSCWQLLRSVSYALTHGLLPATACLNMLFCWTLLQVLPPASVLAASSQTSWAGCCMLPKRAKVSLNQGRQHIGLTSMLITAGGLYTHPCHHAGCCQLLLLCLKGATAPVNRPTETAAWLGAAF
jgi:hypothetical protein